MVIDADCSLILLVANLVDACQHQIGHKRLQYTLHLVLPLKFNTTSATKGFLSKIAVRKYPFYTIDSGLTAL